ncbi:unnamed protein product, partial [Mesorhabditis belari]|uniref:Major facilitator superfamily (MFS) profile domain-containing protein n=1 Tax=Mesorhabditis belari TaxID=2138241 RepID=A0AAF3FI34_9BILA
MKLESAFPSIHLQSTLVGNHINELLRYAEVQGRVVIITLFASLCTVLPVGYNMVVLNVPEKSIQQALNESFIETLGVVLDMKGLSIFWSITVAAQSIGALIGCALVIPLDRHFGAKTCLLSVASSCLLLGSFVMACAQWLSFPPALLLGRILSGIHTGLVCAFVPLFIQEVVPQKIKGSLSCSIHIGVCVGSAVAALLSLPFMLGSPSTWGLLLLFPAIFGLVALISSFFMPETPNRLLHAGSYTAAVDSIKFYYDLDVDDGEVAIQEYWSLVPETPDQMPLWTALSTPSIAKGILLGGVVSATQIFSGSMATISYSTSMFTAVSFIDALIPFLPALGSIISIILTLPSLQLVESHGRRPLLLKTLVLCLISDVLFLIFSLLAVNPEDWWASWLFAATFLLYGIGYNLGTGPVAYFLAAELVPPEASTASLGVAVAVNWASSSLTTLAFYPLNQSIGGWSYMIFIVPSTFFLAFLWRFLPETRHNYTVKPNEASNFCEVASTPYGTFEERLLADLVD